MDSSDSKCIWQGAAGFLKKADHEAAYGGGAGLKAGALLEVAITSVADRRMIGVTTAPAAVAAGTLRDSVVTDMGALSTCHAALFIPIINSHQAPHRHLTMLANQ